MIDIHNRSWHIKAAIEVNLAMLKFKHTIKRKKG